MTDEHIANIKQVEVKLAARSLVNGEIHEAGAIVLLDEKATDGKPFAACFGEVLKAAKPDAKPDAK